MTDQNDPLKDIHEWAAMAPKMVDALAAQIAAESDPRQREALKRVMQMAHSGELTLETLQQMRAAARPGETFAETFSRTMTKK